MRNASAAMTMAIVAMATGAPAAAVVLDFNEFTAALSFSANYQSQGFTIATASPFFLDFYRYGPGYQNNADPTGGALAFSQQPPTPAFVTRDDGGTFTLNSLDVTNFFNAVTGVEPRMITFSFTDASGTSTQDFTVDNDAGFQTVVFNRVGLTRFGFSGPVQIDNLVLDGPTGGGVPEPATWTLAISGFALVGAFARRRRRAFA